MALVLTRQDVTSLAVGLLTFAVSFLLLHWQYLHRGNRVLPPLIFSLPFIGCPYLLTADPRRTLRNFWKRYGDTFRIHTGAGVVVVLNGNEAIRSAMRLYPWVLGSAKPLPTFTTSRVVHAAHTDEGAKWSRRRAILAASYRGLARDARRLFRQIFTDELQGMVEQLRQVYSTAGSGDPGLGFPVKVLAKMAARVTYRLSYGGGETPTKETAQVLDSIASNIHHYAHNAGPCSPLDRYTWSSWIPRLLGCDPKRYESISNLILKFCNRQVSNRLQQLSQRLERPKRDLTAYFREVAVNLKAKDKTCGLTPETLYDGIGDVVRAGTSTATGILSWVVQYLAKYPDAQAEIFQEVSDGAGKAEAVHGDAVFGISREGFPKCASFVYEVMRVVSSLPYSKRRALGDVELFGFFIPQGTSLLLNSDSANMDERIFPQPEEFQPWRFLAEDGAFNLRLLREYVPFGVGKRRCPGEELARQLLLSTIATLTYNFVFREVPECPLPTSQVFGISIAPTPFTINVCRRR